MRHDHTRWAGSPTTLLTRHAQAHAPVSRARTGIADGVQTVVFDAVGQRITELRDSTRIGDRDRLLRNGQARLQVLLDRYIGFNQ